MWCGPRACCDTAASGATGWWAQWAGCGCWRCGSSGAPCGEMVRTREIHIGGLLQALYQHVKMAPDKIQQMINLMINSDSYFNRLSPLISAVQHPNLLVGTWRKRG